MTRAGKVFFAMFLLATSNLSCAQGISHGIPMSPHIANLSAADFLSYLQSPDSQQSELASAYLLGVLDSTEGVYWCDYSQFKTVTLREHVFEELKELDDTTLRLRASTVIREILKKRMPCGIGK